MGGLSVSTDRAPVAIGPYSQGVRAGDFLFIAGQLPLDPATGQMVKGTLEEVAARALDNVKAIVEAAGGTMKDIVKTTVFLNTMEVFQRFNDVYARYFGENPPARATVHISSLPKGATMEIEAIAYLGRS
ncbi:MAG: RidA family protein [Armatimonadetes bacterium]|nr:RidA family protein [Armatimonadota bacterium]